MEELAPLPLKGGFIHEFQLPFRGGGVGIMKKTWWKILCVVILLYTIIQGLGGIVPRQDILNETIRNVYFHVPLWFGMMTLMTASMWFAIKYLRYGNIQDDEYSDPENIIYAKN